MSNLRGWIANALRQCDRIDRQLSKPPKPWQVDGFPNQRAWREQRPDDFANYQSFRWRQSYLRWKRRTGLVIVGTWDLWSWRRKVAEFGNRCAYCGIDGVSALRSGHVLEADHLFALALPASRPDLAPCCTNDIRNIVPACKPCNSSKRDRYVIDWLSSTGRLASAHPLVTHYHDLIARGEACHAL